MKFYNLPPRARRSSQHPEYSGFDCAIYVFDDIAEHKRHDIRRAYRYMRQAGMGVGHARNTVLDLLAAVGTFEFEWRRM